MILVKFFDSGVDDGENLDANDNGYCKPLFELVILAMGQKAWIWAEPELEHFKWDIR